MWKKKNFFSVDVLSMPTCNFHRLFNDRSQEMTLIYRLSEMRPRKTTLSCWKVQKMNVSVWDIFSCLV